MGSAFGRLFVDLDTLPDDGYGTFQLLFLGSIYGYILFFASNLISNGSELLLLVPSLAGLVGSVILPILGAVPDGAILLFSALGENAQEEIAVGVGALAGSTIMLLTLPWLLSLIAGRVNINPDEGTANYKSKPKLYPPGNFSLTKTGIKCGKEVKANANIMLATCGGYLIIQGCAFKYDKTNHPTDAETMDQASVEKWWAFAGFLVSIIGFFSYLYIEVTKQDREVEEGVQDQVRAEAIRRGTISLAGTFCSGLQSFGLHEHTTLLDDDETKRLSTFLKSFFNKYDKSGDNRLDTHELGFLMHDLGENISAAECESAMKQLDTDNSGYIEYTEFVKFVKVYIVEVGRVGYERALRHSLRIVGKGEPANETDDEEEEEEDMPEDLLSLSPVEQQRAIKMRSCWMMFAGTALVLMFSDPMVDVFSNIGERTGVAPFYVSFILAPLASNASELLAAYNYGLKKTSKTITISLTALEGAAIMNNTFCLAIFLILVFCKGLAWQFSAETIAILFVELMMFFVCRDQVQPVYMGFIAMSLYPASIFLVWFLESICNMD